MTNEKIGDIYAKPQKNYISFNEALNLARQDEREKMQTEIGHLEYKIEGLQQALSRNKDEREKMTELPNDAGFMTWFEKYFYKQPSENPLIWTSKSSGRIYSAKQLVSMYNRAMKEAT